MLQCFLDLGIVSVFHIPVCYLILVIGYSKVESIFLFFSLLILYDPSFIKGEKSLKPKTSDRKNEYFVPTPIITFFQMKLMK